VFKSSQVALVNRGRNQLGVSQPTVSEYLKVLTHAGLLKSKRIKQWTFYRRGERRIRELRRAITSFILSARRDQST
jgi:DNA-binding transcriptional ArsR family regulator